MLYVYWADQYVFKPVNGELRWVEVLAGCSTGYRDPEHLDRYVSSLVDCWPGLVYRVSTEPVILKPALVPSRWQFPRRRGARGPQPRKPLPVPALVLETCAGSQQRPVALRRNVS
ncbi:MAG TPA: hypothetical protein DEQ28_08815 [Clostridiales bacterium]|nr:hypothetical protein [Clostridiales bacterium]